MPQFFSSSGKTPEAYRIYTLTAYASIILPCISLCFSFFLGTEPFWQAKRVELLHRWGSRPWEWNHICSLERHIELEECGERLMSMGIIIWCYGHPDIEGGAISASTVLGRGNGGISGPVTSRVWVSGSPAEVVGLRLPHSWEGTNPISGGYRIQSIARVATNL